MKSVHAARWFLILFRCFFSSQIAGVDPEQPFTAEDVKRIAIQRRELEQNPGRPKRKHRKSHGKISFAELARRIADKWKNLKPEAKDLLQERAAIEKTRYLRELEEWTKFNNTSSDGIYSPKATSIGQPGQCPKTPMPTPNYMPSQFVTAPPRRADHTGGPIFHRQSYSESPTPRMHHDAVSAFHGSPPHSPLPHWMVMPSYEQLQIQHQQIRQHFHGQFPPHFGQPQDQQQQQLHQHQQQLLLLQQHQQHLQRCHLSEEHYPYEQRPALVSQSNSFDSSFEAQTDLQPQDLTLEASFLAERYGWSTSSVLEMMCELDRKRRSSRSMTPISDDDGADDVPRGVLDDVRFTPI
jgi:HMG (high mobility group) box